MQDKRGSSMDREIVKTDKKYRRNLFIAYLIGIAVIVAFWRWGIPPLSHYIRELPNKERTETLEILGHAVLLIFIPAAIYLIVIGRKVCTHQAMPYPGMRVIHDTVVVRGKSALFRGRSMIVLGTMMIVLVIFSIIATHNIMLRFKHHPLFREIFYGVEAGSLNTKARFSDVPDYSAAAWSLPAGVASGCEPEPSA
jgi:hypothetical protein